MADAVRLERTMSHIEQNPRLWRQTAWSTETECGTAYCFAGWALQLEGDGIPICVDLRCIDETVGPARHHVHEDRIPGEVLERMRDRDAYYRFDETASGGRMYWVSAVARTVLDLGYVDAEMLFCATNGLDRLRRLVDRHTGGAGGGAGR